MGVVNFGGVRRGDENYLSAVSRAVQTSPLSTAWNSLTSQLNRVDGPTVWCPAPLEFTVFLSGVNLVIDLSIDVCRWARDRRTADKTVVNGSLCELPLASAAVNQFVLLPFMLQTLDEPIARMLMEIRRVLRPGDGRLLTSWLLWPENEASTDRTTETIRCGRMISTYTLTSVGLGITRSHWPVNRLPITVEKWLIRAITAREVECLLTRYGFRLPVWRIVDSVGLGSLQVGVTELHD